MHPRRPLGDRSRLRVTQGPRPSRRRTSPGLGSAGPMSAGLRPPGLAALAALAALAVGVAVALSGCGHQAKAGNASHVTSVTKCGMTRTAANVPVRIEVTKGQVSCTDAMAVEHSYARAIAEGKEPGNGGGGPVTVSGWHCQGFPTPKVLKTGWASKCTHGGAEILAVLPSPSP